MLVKRIKGLQRVAGGFAAALFTHPSFLALRADQVGCLFAWARLALEAGLSTMPRETLRDHSTYFAGMDEPGFERLLAELVALRLVDVHPDGGVELVHLLAAMSGKSAESERRKAGWEKRRQAAASAVPGPTVAAPVKKSVAPATQGSRPIQAQASLLDEAPLAPSLAPASRPKPAKDADHLRIGAGDEDESHIIVRLEVKGGQVVEFTDGFAKSMEPLYPGVDVHREMLRAAEWCRGKPERRKTLKGARSFITGWLSRSSQRREVTMAVVASGNERNGFGQGGRYGSSASSQSPQDGDGLDDFADFADLIEPRQGARAPAHAQ